MEESDVQKKQSEPEPPQIKPKRGRERKKSLYKDVAKQMDVYFGDSNLLQDRFLKKEIDATEDGFVPLSIFLKFNKIRHLGANTEDIAKAVTHFSTLLEVNDAKEKIRRTKPLASQEDLDSRTVYVEGLPLTVNHDWVKCTLSKYDIVNYVSLPRYPTTKSLKGFAFVEFASTEGVKACLSAIGTREFSSVHPFPKAGSKDIQRMEKSVGKTTTNDSEVPTLKKRNKKRHSASTDTLPSDTNSVAAGDVTTAAKESTAGETEVAKEESATDEPASKKAKRVQGEQTVKVSKKRKRKSSQSKSKDEPPAKVADLDSETDTQSMKSSVKVDSKKTKNETTTSRKESTKKDKIGSSLRAISKSEWLLLKRQFLDIQKKNMATLKEKMKQQKARERALEFSNKNLEVLEIIPDVVVAVKADKEIDKDKVKSLVPEEVGVSYIDVSVGSTSGFIRCKSCEDASKLLHQTCGEGYELSLLQGEAEKTYWDKLNQQRLDKRTNKTKTKRATNKKGTKKVLEQHTKQAKKAQKNSHVLFNDD